MYISKFIINLSAIRLKLLTGYIYYVSRSILDHRANSGRDLLVSALLEPRVAGEPDSAPGTSPTDLNPDKASLSESLGG